MDMLIMYLINLFHSELLNDYGNFSLPFRSSQEENSGDPKEYRLPHFPMDSIWPLPNKLGHLLGRDATFFYAWS